MMELGQEGNIVGAVESSVIIRDPGREAKSYDIVIPCLFSQICLDMDIEFFYPLLPSYFFLESQTLKVSLTHNSPHLSTH